MQKEVCLNISKYQGLQCLPPILRILLGLTKPIWNIVRSSSVNPKGCLCWDGNVSLKQVVLDRWRVCWGRSMILWHSIFHLLKGDYILTLNPNPTIFYLLKEDYMPTLHPHPKP